MAVQVQHRRGTASAGASFIGAEGELIWLTDEKRWVGHDGATPGGATNAAIRAAQAGLVDGVTVFAGPDSDTLNGSYRYDDQHWNASGNAAISTLWTAAVSAVL